MEKHRGSVEITCHDEKRIEFAARDYMAELQDTEAPITLSIMNSTEFDPESIGRLERGQMWRCPDSQEIFESCKYQVIATDMGADTLEPAKRAKLDMDFMESVAELFPECKAIYFQNSGKLFKAEEIRSHAVLEEQRFVYFAVNIRFFSEHGTENLVVDTLGMGTLGLVDLQYYFRGMDPNLIVQHAYNYALFISQDDDFIRDGDTVTGLKDGEMDQEISWECRYEDALIQPGRTVINVYMNEYAAGAGAE